MHLIKCIACVFAVSLSFLSAVSQPLSVYVNLQNQVMVWDKGAIRKIDYLPPVEIKTGRTTIPYLDNSRSFKIYYKGGTRTINQGFTNEFVATDNLVAFLNARSLHVFEEGNSTHLSSLCKQYYVGDSIVVFLDGIRNEYKAYYDGNIYPIESFLAGDPLSNLKVSDNIAAYDNYAGQFRIFYRGDLISQEAYEVSSFKVGRNTVAYVDANRQFKIFNNGKTIVAEAFPPESYMVGDDVVAYVSNDGYFKICYKDSIQTIGFFRPRYQVEDFIVAYQDASGYFNVFYKGEITALETYFPDNLTIHYNSLAYVNRMNVLRMFSEGEVYDVSTMFSNSAADRNSWQMAYDVLQYKVGSNLYRIFYKGREY
jgi:hypothetical protein